MTATRREQDTFLSGNAAAIPPAADHPASIYVAVDAGFSYYSDGAVWTLVSQVSPGGPGNVLDYDTANLTQFAGVQLDAPWSLTFDNTIRRIPSGFSGHFQLRPGDIPLGDGHERAEIIGPGFVEGDDKYYGWSTYFPDPGLHPTDTAGTGDTNIFTQIHENKGIAGTLPTATVPPLRVSLNTNTFTYPFHWTASLAGGDLNGSFQPISGVTAYDLGTVLYNQWVDFVVHILHSHDAAVGQFEVWVNGVSATGTVTKATKYTDRNSYFKQGYYRSNQALTTDIYHDMTIIGASYDDVDPSRFD